MRTRCLGGFSVMWVTKLLISPGKIRTFCPKLAFLFIFGRLVWCPVGGLVGGCGAQVASRKTLIYFLIIYEKGATAEPKLLPVNSYIRGLRVKKGRVPFPYFGNPVKNGKTLSILPSISTCRGKCGKVQTIFGINTKCKSSKRTASS